MSTGESTVGSGVTVGAGAFGNSSDGSSWNWSAPNTGVPTWVLGVSGGFGKLLTLTTADRQSDLNGNATTYQFDLYDL